MLLLLSETTDPSNYSIYEGDHARVSRTFLSPTENFNDVKMATQRLLPPPRRLDNERHHYVQRNRDHACQSAARPLGFLPLAEVIDTLFPCSRAVVLT